MGQGPGGLPRRSQIVFFEYFYLLRRIWFGDLKSSFLNTSICCEGSGLDFLGAGRSDGYAVRVVVRTGSVFVGILARLETRCLVVEGVLCRTRAGDGNRAGPADLFRREVVQAEAERQVHPTRLGGSSWVTASRRQYTGLFLVPNQHGPTARTRTTNAALS